MKNYRLKKWYPSLPKNWVVGDVAIPWEKQKCYYHIPNKSGIVFKEEVEDNPDFWELIEEQEPLFITEDGVECFDGDEYISIGDCYSKIYMIAYNYDAPYSSDVKRFFHESNADDYIWKNKPIFSYNDIKKLQPGGGGVFYDVAAIAKERSKE